MGMTFVDISMPIEDAMVRWPDDPPVSVQAVKEPAPGDPATVSRLSMGSHTGTHVDAPRHYLPVGAGVDRIALRKLIGRCVVADCRGMTAVGVPQVEGIDLRRTPRVLFRTDNSDRAARRRFSRKYVSLTSEAARWLASHGAMLVGVDGPSVESFDAVTGPGHRALLRMGVVIVEGLRLTGVAAGEYELICLPLRITRGDGGPARAVLVSQRRR